ncbi:MAG: phosphopantetheine-binding protein [Bacteroidales bacterium]|jgi:acyl carrier protein|nr:phosphopantetheine-binding protein [Bacteroidales bacterium]
MVDITLIEKINIILSDEFEVDIEVIQPDAPLMDTLDLDSLDLVDMVVLIEHNFGFTVVAKDFVGIKTFNDFYNFINSRLDEKRESPD